jgi:hypothetical protein
MSGTTVQIDPMAVIQAATSLFAIVEPAIAALIADASRSAAEKKAAIEDLSQRLKVTADRVAAVRFLSDADLEAIAAGLRGGPALLPALIDARRALAAPVDVEAKPDLVR